MQPPVPPQPAFDGRQLSSWKEIAAYLGVSVRTAQKWEMERGLPVRRLPGGRGMVIIGVADIDAWLHREPAPPQDLPPRRNFLWLGGLGAATLATLAGTAYLRKGAPWPADHRIAGNNFIAIDNQGKELWRHSFSFRLGNEPVTRGPHLSYIRYSWLGDVDGDGTPEFLFFPIPERPLLPKDWELFCFSATGNIKWRFRPGQSAESFPIDLRPPYCPLNLVVFDHAGEKRIALASVHNTWFPSQIAILSGQGKLLQDYWHSGHLTQIGVAPYGPNGSPILLAGGIANGYRGAVVVALDPATGITGAVSTEENPQFQLPGQTGHERARILFPRSHINTRKGPYNLVLSFRTVASDLEVQVGEDLEASAEVIHRFGPDFQYLGAGLSSNYVGRYNELQQQGLLQGPLKAEEESRQLSQIRWLTAPKSNTPNNTPPPQPPA